MQKINLNKSKKINKKLFCPIVDSIKIGDLIHYCPADIEKRYHDFGIVVEVELNDINSKNYINNIKVFWSKDHEVCIHSRNQILNSIKAFNENYDIWKVYQL